MPNEVEKWKGKKEASWAWDGEAIRIYSKSAKQEKEELPYLVIFVTVPLNLVFY